MSSVLAAFEDLPQPPSFVSARCGVPLPPFQRLAVYAEVGVLLAGLFDRSDGTLILSRHRDADCDGDFCLTFAGDRLRVASHREYLAEALSVALVKPKEKACRACKQTLPIERYSHNRNNADGRVNRCRDCERKRIAAYAKRKALEP